MVFVQIKLKTLYLDNYTTNFSPFYRLKKSNWLKKRHEVYYAGLWTACFITEYGSGFFFFDGSFVSGKLHQSELKCPIKKTKKCTYIVLAV